MGTHNRAIRNNTRKPVILLKIHRRTALRSKDHIPRTMKIQTIRNGELPASVSPKAT
jgi:hypothetical protein